MKVDVLEHVDVAGLMTRFPLQRVLFHAVSNQGVSSQIADVAKVHNCPLLGAYPC